MRKGESTRQRIIEQAAPLFNQRGFEGCSMQDVLDATGLEKGGVYRHFASKEELAAEVFRYSWAQAMKVRREGLDEVEGAVEKLRIVVRRFGVVPGPVAGGCPLMNTAIDTDDGNPVLRALAHAGIRDWKRRLCRIVEDGTRAGEIRADVEPRWVANSMIATLEGALMISRLEGNRTAIRDAQVTLESMLDGIVAV
jgi:TetR/AcrR family transcriptional repressor of nem operon